MNKNRIAVSAFLSLCSTVILADPVAHQTTFTCPLTRVVSNFGDYLAGYGVETLFGENRSVYFKSLTKNSGIPSNLTSYATAGTNYDGTTSQVTCNYTSNNPNNKPFSLTYTISNGAGGVVTVQTDSMISIQLPIGFDK